MADVTYIEPLNLKTLTQIIDKEQPDALLPNLGGQSALNLSSELFQTGVLKKYGVQMIGVSASAIERGEDRMTFKATMEKLGIEMPSSKTVNTVEDAEAVVAQLVEQKELEEIPTSRTRTVLVHRGVIEDVAGSIERSLEKLHEQFPLNSMIDRSRLMNRLKYVGSELLLQAVLDRLPGAGLYPLR